MKKLILILTLIFLLVLSGCNMAGTTDYFDKTSPEPSVDTSVTLTESAQSYIGKNVEAVVETLQNAGFKEVQKEAIDDLTSAEASMEDTVKIIEVNGDSNFTDGAVFGKTAKVVVYYHRLPKIKIPASQETMANMDYVDAAKLFAESGFINIKTNERYDLETDKDFETTVSIGGNSEFDTSTEIPFDTEILLEGCYPANKYSVNIIIDFPGNWFFNKYDVEVKLDGKQGKTLKHGEDGQLSYELLPGTYKLVLTGKGEKPVTEELDIEVSQGVDLTYSITCNADNISVKEKSVVYTDQKSEKDIIIQYSANYYLWKNYEQCVEVLQNEGFTNIELKPTTDHLWNKTPVGNVVGITIDGKTDFRHGEIISKDAKVIVSYHIPTGQFKEKEIVVDEQDVFPLEYSLSDEFGAQDVTIQILHDVVLEKTEDNLYRAKAEGYTDVQLKYKNVVLSDCRVRINRKIIPIEKLTVAQDVFDIAVGTTFTLDYTIAPENANYLDITKVFTGESVQENEQGELVAVAAGETVITIFQDDRKLAEVKINAVDVPIEGIAFEEGDIVIGVGRTQEIKFVTTPEHASNIRLSVETKSAKIATAELNSKGEHVVSITGIKVGETTIKITSKDGAVVEKKVTVSNILPDSITVTAPTEQIAVGQTGSFSVKFDPVDTTQQKVTWTSSDAKVLKVNKDGTFTALKAGKVTIIAKHANGVQGVIEVEAVPVPVSGIEISSNWSASREFKKNDKMKLTVKMYPENATDKSVTWSTSDASVATVSSKGEVKAVAHGTATITAKTSNGITASFDVSVALSPQKFKITYTLTKKSTNHVGNSWSKGFEFNEKKTKSGTIVSILPGEEFEVCAWARENDSRPDDGSFFEKITLTNEMCAKGFVFEDDFYVRENSGRYSGNRAKWHVKIKFTPVN